MEVKPIGLMQKSIFARQMLSAIVFCKAKNMVLRSIGGFCWTFCVDFVNKIFQNLHKMVEHQEKLKLRSSKDLAKNTATQLCCILLCKMHNHHNFVYCAKKHFCMASCKQNVKHHVWKGNTNQTYRIKIETLKILILDFVRL